MSDRRIRAPFDPAMSLESARDLLRGRAADGETCPCCTQRVKVYRRPLNSVPARGLIALYEQHGREFAHMPTLAREHLPDVAGQGGYLVLGAHWGLIVGEHRHRQDGGRTGWWAVTDKGERWLSGQITLPRYALIYDGRCLGHEGQQITVDDALGESFDFARLVRARAHAAGSIYADPTAEAA